MKTIKKTAAAAIIAALFLTTASSANASGFIFNWEPFFVDNSLINENPDRKEFIKDLTAELKTEFPEYYLNKPDFSSSLEENPKPSREKDSVLDNFRISIFTPGTPTMNRNELSSDDEKASKFIDAVTSLIYDDSRIKSLETIGKMMEPRINFYFEF